MKPNYVAPELLEDYRKAGKIASIALEFGASLIKPGVKVVEVLDKVEERIKELGAYPAFPAQISLNEVAAHFCPEANDNIAFKEGDIVKLDVGAHVNGCVGDNALTVDLGSHKELVQASKEARDEAVKLATPGRELHEIGKKIHEVITSYGFTPIKNLSGHGVGVYKIHTSPSVPNYPNNDSTKLEEDHVIAIEPFATDGSGMIFNSDNATLFSQISTSKPRSQMARAVLKEIAQYKGLPFTTRWVSRVLGEGRTRYGIKELKQLGIIHEFPPLPERAGGLVSQHEHTVLVKDKPEILTRN